MCHNDFMDEASGYKVAHFTGDEFLAIGDIIKTFWENVPTSNPPKFVMVMGGVGAGKTTIRRQQFADGYVNIDAGEIYQALLKSYDPDDPKLEDYTAFATHLILKECILEKKNIVIEIIGDSAEAITPVIDKMKEIGYEISVSGITCDPAEAYERHLKAVKEDKNYLSAYYTQDATLGAFYTYFDLGAVPVQK